MRNPVWEKVITAIYFENTILGRLFCTKTLIMSGPDFISKLSKWQYPMHIPIHMKINHKEKRNAFNLVSICFAEK